MKKARKIAVITLLSLSAIIFIGGILFLLVMTDGAKLNASALPTEDGGYLYYDLNDEPMQNGSYVTLDQVSEHIKHAFIAVEDKRFYQHGGIDVKRTVGAILKNVKDRKFSQGGSTISNQLVKNTHLSNEKTLKRKIKEAKITFELEKRYKKDEILEMYLNVLYFGKGIYGVKNACRTIYGKSPAEVSAIEAASLAATIANPAKYSVLTNYEQNRKRTEMVLWLMQEEGYLSAAEYNEVKESEIIINYTKNNNNCNEIYVNSTFNEAKSIINSAIKLGTKAPYRIYTHYDPMAQNAATNATILMLFIFTKV